MSPFEHSATVKSPCNRIILLIWMSTKQQSNFSTLSRLTVFRIVLCATLCCTILQLNLVQAQNNPGSDKVTFLYTGKSLGVLGNTRFQKEHELLTEQAIKSSIEFKLVSHACWRGKGVTIFLPSDEPEGGELELILAKRDQWEYQGHLEAIRSENVVLYQDPERDQSDMLDMILRNENASKEFPDLEMSYVEVYKTQILDDMKVLIVQEPEMVWPSHIDHWEIGEINRVDFGKESRLFELPINFGTFSSRATILKNIAQDSSLTDSKIIKVDLGHRNGDFNLSPTDRIHLDYHGLKLLDYEFVVPYEFELSMGLQTLQELKLKFPEIELIASNVTTTSNDVFKKSHIYEINGIKIGMLGLVDPNIELNLPREILNEFEFLPLFPSVEKIVSELYDQNVDLVIAFSNMSADQNALLGERVKGLQVIAANLASSGIPYSNPYHIKVPQMDRRRLGRPHLIANSFDYGMAIGRLDLNFESNSEKKKNNKPISLTHPPIQSALDEGAIYFKEPDELLIDSNKERISAMWKLLELYPETTLEINSHSTSKETPSFTLYRSILSAEIIKSHLVDQGIESDRIVIKGYGDQFIPNDTEYKNRSEGYSDLSRIEFRIHLNETHYEEEIGNAEKKEVKEFNLDRYRQFRELTLDQLSYRIEIAKSRQLFRIGRTSFSDIMVEELPGGKVKSYTVGSYSNYSEASSAMENMNIAKGVKYKIIPYIDGLRIAEKDIEGYSVDYDDLASFDQTPELEWIDHRLYSVNDRIDRDTSLMSALMSNVELEKKEKGDLMFPAFIDIIEQEPSLQSFDYTTRQGRVSKRMWEEFISRLLRLNIPTEVAIIRPVSSFLPLIGKLHEREVRSWLWTEDEIVLCDMKGRDLKRLLESSEGQELVTSGIKSVTFSRRKFWTVMGRPLLDDAYYRVATTDVIHGGALREYFYGSLRMDRLFTRTEDGLLKADREGKPLQLRNFVLDKLKEIRSLGKGKTHHSNIASLLLPDQPYEALSTFNFLNPTLWTSFNRSYKGDGYGSIPESRINASNSFVIGINGGMILTRDGATAAWDASLSFGFAKQSAEISQGVTQVTENMDDFLFSITYRNKGKNRNRKFEPFLRAEYDTEFTPTINPNNLETNPRQKILRGLTGLSKRRSLNWPILEIGLTVENDFANKFYQYGIQGRSLGRFPLDKRWRAVYSITNNFNYYFPKSNDSERELSFKLNSIHELLVPLFGDLSISAAADFFFFRGKLDINNDPGMSMLFRVGISYNRLWKPKFQPLM